VVGSGESQISHACYFIWGIVKNLATPPSTLLGVAGHDSERTAKTTVSADDGRKKRE
jgi:hypothetical protein